MKETLITQKSALVAAGTALGTFLGWKGIMMAIWVAMMALDYLSGTMAACKDGKWSSAAARQGLWHKGGMILVVTVAAVADAAMVMIGEFVPMGLHWPGVLLPLVLAWYIITELGSILENAVKMGAKVPSWLVKLMKASLELADRAGEAAADTTK